MVKILKSNSASVKQCVVALSEGKTIAYPTETVYGLGVDALNREAVKKLFQIKKRDTGKPVSIAVPDVEKAQEFGVFDETALTLARKFLPGPLTLVLKAILPIPMITLDNKIGIRIPSNSFARELTKQFHNPITATSANISGLESVTRAADLDKMLLDHLEVVIDSSESEYSVGSTVVEVSNSDYKVLREGAISKKEIDETIHNF